MRQFILMISSLLVLLSVQSSLAQKSDEASSEFYAEMGNLLPDQIEDVTEILPMWGLGAGWRRSDQAYTFQYASANAKGVKLTSYSFETRKDVPISSLIGTVSLGADLQALARPGDDGRTYYGGGHVGGGILALISSGLYVRMNMKFTAGPGVALFLGFGLLYRPSEDIIKK